MKKSDLAQAFSNGRFEETYNFIAEKAEWVVVEESIFSGKEAIVKNCEQISQYFKSVTTRFETLNVISDGNKVVVNGTAEFLKNGKKISFVSACDIYEFNESDFIEKIISYCIQAK